ncbi:MAG: hypothetical protein AVDCRST_MAG77-1190, partial [uncultured Chloroflexi bacterium]
EPLSCSADSDSDGLVPVGCHGPGRPRQRRLVRHRPTGGDHHPGRQPRARLQHQRRAGAPAPARHPAVARELHRAARRWRQGHTGEDVRDRPERHLWIWLPDARQDQHRADGYAQGACDQHGQQRQAHEYAVHARRTV